jgi:RecB family exonuclease
MSNPKRHSFSRLDTFANVCQRRHAYDALLKDWVDTPASLRGNHVHDALETMAKHMIAGQTAVEAAEYVAEHPPPGYLKEEALAGYLQRAVPVFEHITPIPGGTEAWFDEAGGLDICGKIDLQSATTPVFDNYGLPTHSVPGLCVLDHKTTASPARIKDKWEAKKSLQLKIYCLATGARNAGFLWYLPSGPVKGTMVHFEEDDLAIAKLWLRHTTEVVQSRWAEAKRNGSKMYGHSDELVEGYDLSGFSLAAPGHGLCNAKFCEHWDRCLGKKDADG